MDLKSKGTEWVGNMYQKFEAICHEVDDFVTQDTVKYVENHVQTVGDSVKRFYSDVVQDLIPSEVKPGKYESQAGCPTPNYTFESRVRSTISFEENHVYNIINKSSVFDIVLEVNETKEELVDSKPNIAIEANETEERMMGEKSCTVAGENGADEETSQPEEFELISIENKNLNESSSLSECIGEKNVILSEIPTGGADNCSIDITDPSMETIELSEKAELDEGCVLVDSELLSADSCRAQRPRSYKKILRDAFASKKRISKEYEQLGILYGDIDIESSPQRVQNLLLPSSSLDSKKSPSQDIWDREWELL